MRIAGGQCSILFLHAGKLVRPSRDRRVGHEGSSNTSERATTREKKGRNLEITRPNGKKTVEEGKDGRLGFCWKGGKLWQVGRDEGGLSLWRGGWAGV